MTQTNNPRSYDLIPERTIYALKRWRDTPDHMPGDFLTSVLTNNLRGAVGHADGDNSMALLAIVVWCHNELPSIAWGSEDRVVAWWQDYQNRIKVPTT